MNRIAAFGLLLAVALPLLAVVTEQARADDCTPAICASISPACWLAYEQVTVKKNKEIKNEAHCKQLAKDGDAFSTFLGVQGVTTKIGICACAAAYWSLGDAQGVPPASD